MSNLDLDVANFSQPIQRLLNAGQFSNKLAFVQLDCSAARTGNYRVRLYPSNRLRMLMTASFARDFDSFGVKQAHVLPFQRTEPAQDK